MELYIRLQLQTILSAIALGAAAGLVYDLLRSVRIRCREKAVTYLTDSAYVLALGWALLRFALSIGQGELRLYVLPCALLGGIMYWHFLTPILRPLWQFWWGVAAQFFRWILIPVSFIQVFFKIIQVKIKKIIYFFHNFCKIKISILSHRHEKDKEVQDL